MQRLGFSSGTIKKRVATVAKVLLVEDEFHIASLISDALAGVGYDIMGPVATTQHALRLIDEVLPRGAVLNFQLRDGDSTPVAAVLQAAGIWLSSRATTTRRPCSTVPRAKASRSIPTA